MLYQLLYPLHEMISALNVFRYITFRSALAAITAGLVTRGFAVWIAAQAAPIVVLLASGPVFLAAYVGILMVLPGGRTLVFEIIGNLRLLRDQPIETTA